MGGVWLNTHEDAVCSRMKGAKKGREEWHLYAVNLLCRREEIKCTCHIILSVIMQCGLWVSHHDNKYLRWVNFREKGLFQFTVLQIPAHSWLAHWFGACTESAHHCRNTGCRKRLTCRQLGRHNTHRERPGLHGVPWKRAPNDLKSPIGPTS